MILYFIFFPLSLEFSSRGFHTRSNGGWRQGRVKSSPPPSWVPWILVFSLSILVHCRRWDGNQQSLWLSLPWQMCYLKGNRDSLGSHTECPGLVGSHWPPAPSLAFRIICSFQGKVLGRSTSLWVLIALSPLCLGTPLTFRRLLVLARWPRRVPWKMPVGACLCPPRSFRGQEHLVGTGEERSFPEPWVHLGGCWLA